MFRIDDRAGNVMTTVAMFLVATGVLYIAREAFLILLLSLLFAYLLEPGVTLLQRSRLGRGNRDLAIGQVYLVGALIVGGLGYEFGPPLVTQIKNFKAAVPSILQGPSDGKAAVDSGAQHSLNSYQRQRIDDWLAQHQDSIARVFERGAASVAYIATRSVWLLAVPILAIFILRDGRQFPGGFVRVADVGRDYAVVERILRRIDGMLAKYVRAQLALGGLSFAFYSIAMLLLGFPYAFAVGFFGGLLEFLPAVGWVISALIILTVGFLTHAHWIWMAVLLGLWRLVQDYVNSPRIMGSTLELEPLTVLFALMVGGQLAGIAGVLLSVPAVGMMKIVWLECFSAESKPVSHPDQSLTQVSA